MLINKEIIRVHLGNFRYPGHANAGNGPNSVGDYQAGVYGIRQFTCDVEIQPGRGDQAKVGRVRKKGPRNFWFNRQMLLSYELIGFHMIN